MTELDFVPGERQASAEENHSVLAFFRTNTSKEHEKAGNVRVPGKVWSYALQSLGLTRFVTTQCGALPCKFLPSTWRLTRAKRSREEQRESKSDVSATQRRFKILNSRQFSSDVPLPSSDRCLSHTLSSPYYSNSPTSLLPWVSFWAEQTREYRRTIMTHAATF